MGMRGEEAKLPSKTALPTLPHPEEFEALAMPSQDCGGLHHRQTFPPATPEARQQNPEEAIDGTEPGSMPSMH